MSETGRSRQAERFAQGFTLIEVVVAIALLAIVVVPICGSLLALSARAAALSSQAAVEHGALETGDDAWRWSDVEIDDARWEGPTLNVEAGAAPGLEQIEIGWWVDGWYAGSAEDGGSGSRSIDPPVGGWPSSARLLTVRARRGSGSWGPAWRMALPAVSTAPDGAPLPPPAGLLTGEVPGAASAVVVVHSSGAGAPVVRVGSESAPAIEVFPEGATSLLLGVGALELYCDGALQSLMLKNGDVVHLFF